MTLVAMSFASLLYDDYQGVSSTIELSNCYGISSVYCRRHLCLKGFVVVAFGEFKPSSVLFEVVGVAKIIVISFFDSWSCIWIGSRLFFGVGRLNLVEARVAAEQSVLMVPESPLMSLRKPQMSALMCNETWWVRSISITWGTSLQSWENP